MKSIPLRLIVALFLIIGTVYAVSVINYFGNNNVCNDFNGIYAAEIHNPSNAIHLIYRTENGSYYCRNRIDIIIHIITIK